MELSIVTYIKAHGLNKAVKDFKLIVRDYPHKILLKYSQIDSDMSLSEVQECRGLILERDTWKVMSMAFTKFFNAAEGHAAKIDWTTAKIFEKSDGSLLNIYWDWVTENWCVSTTGMAEAEGEVNDKPNTSFATLFWDTLAKYKFDVDKLEKGYTYSFELMTPYNIVVCPHGESKVALLAIRKLDTLEEVQFESILNTFKYFTEVPLAKVYDMKSSNTGHLIATFGDMSAFDEGYVVCDANFNRIKLKNPKYIALHHLKGKSARHNIFVIIKTNEIDEFILSFPERLDEINGLKVKYDSLIEKLEGVWDELKEFKPKNITKGEQKKYAMKLFDTVVKHDIKQFSGLFFMLKDGKTESVKDFILEYDNKNLYEMFTN